VAGIESHRIIASAFKTTKSYVTHHATSHSFSIRQSTVLRRSHPARFHLNAKTP
jgi:hypothetical protein